MAKLTAQKLVDMADGEFDALCATLQPKLDRILMSPPRKPRGEKPATTIRYLKRQIANLQASCALHRKISEDREKVIAGYDAQLNEANERTNFYEQMNRSQSHSIAASERMVRIQAERLAFLEGYYEKSQEAISKISPILPASSLVAGDQSETKTGGREGDQKGLSPGRQGSQGAGLDQGAARLGPRLGDPLWRQRPHNFSDT